MHIAWTRMVMMEITAAAATVVVAIEKQKNENNDFETRILQSHLSRHLHAI